MTMLLPLVEGERPLFAARSLLEHAYKDFKRTGNVFESIDETSILKMATELYALSEILILRDKKGLREHSTDLFQLLTELPLFFNKQQVYAWEVEKKWNSTSFTPYKNMLIEYENIFNTLTPSIAYQTKEDASAHIWKQWLMKTEIKEVTSVLEDSAKRLLEWNKQRVEKSCLEKNIQSFSKYLKLDKKTVKNWFYLYALGQHSSAIWNLYLKEVSQSSITQTYQLIGVWEKALALNTDSINGLLFEDSILVSLGFLNSNKMENENWKEQWEQINLIHIPHINKKLINSKNILNLFLKEHEQAAIPLEWFEYIKNLTSISNILTNLKRGKILIYGKDFSGKKSFILSLISRLNKKAYFINPRQKQQEPKKENDNSELLLADMLLQTLSDSVLVVNDGDKKYQLDDEKVLNTSHCLQIWTVSDISNMDQKFLNTFDFVLEMELPPLKERLALSEKIFSEHNTAFRVAQSVKEPSQIIKIGKLCHVSQNFSWDYISMLIYNFKKINQKNENKINLNKLEIDDNVTALVGYPALSQTLENLVEYYKNPNSYSKFDAKANKGMLLIGAPGTGKTHFARNLSKLVNIPLFAPDTSLLADNLAMMDNLFNELKIHSPCILFLDEIDTLIANPKVMGHINLEKAKIVNTFLAHVDGIENNDGIFIIGATHRKDNFDPAALRSGRLSKVIHISPPNEKAREEIWKEHLKNKPLSPDLNIKELLSLSIGFSGADIMESVNRAAILAVEEKKSCIDITCFKIVCDEVFWGYADKATIVHEKQKEVTAYHEAGHALLALYYGYQVPRITIRPRKNSLGATHFTDNEEGIFNMSKEDIAQRVQIMLGGICAEKLIFSHYENGGTQDLRLTHVMIREAICSAGLGQEGAIHLGDPELWSNERKVKIEQEEKSIIEEQFEKTEMILMENKNLLIELAQTLLTHKELSGDIMNYFKKKMNKLNTLHNYKRVHNEQVLHKD